MHYSKRAGLGVQMVGGKGFGRLDKRLTSFLVFLVFVRISFSMFSTTHQFVSHSRLSESRYWLWAIWRSARRIPESWHVSESRYQGFAVGSFSSVDKISASIVTVRLRN